jgi:hypothetical protein
MRNSSPDGSVSAMSPVLTLLRPLTVGELLDEAFDLYRRSCRLFFGIAVLLYAPLGMLIVVGAGSTGSQALANVLSVMAGLLTTCALASAAMERIHGRLISIAGAYRRGMGRILRLLSGTIVGGLALFAGILLLVIPGIIVALWMQLLAPVAVGENRGGVRALERCRWLAAGQLWRLVAIMLGLALVVLIFNLAILGMVGLLVGVFGLEDTAPGEPVDTTAQYVAYVVIFLVYTLSQSAWAPLLTLTQCLTYVDLRIRKEAYDLELLTEAAEARVTTAPPVAPSPMPGHMPPPGPAGAVEPAT